MFSSVYTIIIIQPMLFAPLAMKPNPNRVAVPTRAQYVLGTLNKSYRIHVFLHRKFQIETGVSLDSKSRPVFERL